jgi:hypothetical protein
MHNAPDREAIRGVCVAVIREAHDDLSMSVDAVVQTLIDASDVAGEPSAPRALERHV